MSTHFSTPNGPPKLNPYSANDTGMTQNFPALRMAHFALDQCGKGVVWTTPQAKIIYINEQACRCLGYTRDELLQMSYPDLDPEFPATRWEENWTRFKQPGGVTFESRLHQKDGSVCPVAITVSHLEVQGEEYCCLVFRDIPEQKLEAERKLHFKEDLENLVQSRTAELQQTQQLIQEVIDSSPDWIFVKDLEHRFLLVNQSFASSQRLKSSDMVGHPDSDFWSREFCEGSEAMGMRGFHVDDREAFNGHMIHNPHDPATLHDGTVRVFDTYKSPLRDKEGRIYGVLCYCRDVTELRKSDENIKRANEGLETRVRERTAQLRAAYQRMERSLDEKDLIAEELRRSQILLTAIVENLPDMIFVKEAKDLRFVHFNKAGEELLGYSRQDLIGRNDYEFFPKDQADFFRAKDQEVLKNRKLVEISEETIHTGRAGTRILHTKKVPILNAQGHPEYLLGISQDITKSKRVELERAEQELLVNLMLNTGPGCINRVSADGTLLQINPTGLRLVEADHEEEVLGLSVFDLVAPEHRKPFEEMHQAVLKGTEKTLQFEVIGLKGTRRWMETYASPFRNPITNQVEHLAVTHDISTRKRSEEMIKQLLRQNQLILHSAGEGIYGLDKNGLTTFVNPAGANMLGYEPGELIGIPMHVTMHHTKPDGSPYPTKECPMYAAFRDGAIHQIDTEVLWRKDGTSFPADYTSTPIRNELGTVVGAVVTFRDITERKQKEAELENREERIRRILDTLPTAAYTFDRDGLITYFNQPAINLWGRTPKLNNPKDRFCGSFKMYTPDGTEISPSPPLLESVVKEGLRIEGREVLIERPDGSFRSILSHANPLRDASGQIVGGVNVLIDITESNKIQRSLKLSEHSIRELYNITSSQHFTFDQKIHALLELGCRRLGLPLGTLTKRVGEQLELEFLCGPDQGWAEHSLIPICQSFCGITLQRSEPLVFEHAGESIWKTSQAYHSLGLEAYLGTRVTVGDGVYGSLCFLDRKPYVGKFTEADIDFLQLMARWIGGELERKQAKGALQEANARLQTMSQQLLTVQETERRQLAHDLHDEIGQTLTAVKINLQTLGQPGSPPNVPGILRDSMQILDQMLKHVRELSLDLRPSMLDDLGLVPAVRWYVNRQAERAGWKVEIRIDEDLPRLSGDQATASFRVIQEALTNVMRHAQATHVQVELHCKNENLEILITDNGIGFDFLDSVEKSSSGQSFGLLSMQERVRLLKGHLNIVSQRGKGTQVATRIPLKIFVNNSKA